MDKYKTDEVIDIERMIHDPENFHLKCDIYFYFMDGTNMDRTQSQNCMEVK